MIKVIGLVACDAIESDSFLLDKPNISSTLTSVDVGGKHFQVEGVGFFEDHTVWISDPSDHFASALPGWIKGRKITLTQKGNFRAGERVTVVEDPPPAEVKSAPIAFEEAARIMREEPIPSPPLLVKLANSVGIKVDVKPLPLDNDPILER